MSSVNALQLRLTGENRGNARDGMKRSMDQSNPASENATRAEGNLSVPEKVRDHTYGEEATLRKVSSVGDTEAEREIESCS